MGDNPTHLYSSTLPAPHMASASLGVPPPQAAVFPPQASHFGWFTHEKNSRLNHRISSSIRQSSNPMSGAAAAAAAGEGVKDSNIALASVLSFSSGTQARAFSCKKRSSYFRVVEIPDSSFRRNASSDRSNAGEMAAE